MKKIKRIFKADPENRSLVTKEINEGMEWVFNGNSYPRWKRNGLPCAIIKGVFYKRLQVDSLSGLVPDNAIKVDEDKFTNKIIYWVPILNTPENKYFLEALERFKQDHKFWLDNLGGLADGTYELCGPKIQGNKENLSKHILLPHNSVPVHWDVEVTYDNLKEYFMKYPRVEGFVFYHKMDSSLMGKIRRKDFRLK